VGDGEGHDPVAPGGESAGWPPRYLLIVSEADPIAVQVAARWPVGASTGHFVDGAPVRDLGEGRFVLRRPGRHIHDDHVDRRLPTSWRAARVPLVFPSIHRSERGVACFTVHPLGNPGPSAEVGGVPHQLVPTAPRLMTAALRRLDELAPEVGLPATFEATHHGPSLDLPAFFAEIGTGAGATATDAWVDGLARTLLTLEATAEDRVAVGFGGGHYAPHFTELAIERRWSFGHLIARHDLAGASSAILRQAIDRTPECDGFLLARAADAEVASLGALTPRLRDRDAPPRGARGGPTTSPNGAGPAAGT
jgi:D-tyrosyl-tRNA(Tyr) deacylase